MRYEAENAAAGGADQDAIILQFGGYLAVDNFTSSKIEEGHIGLRRAIQKIAVSLRPSARLRARVWSSPNLRVIFCKQSPGRGQDPGLAHPPPSIFRRRWARLINSLSPHSN